MVHLAQVKKIDSTVALDSLQLHDDAHHPTDPACVYGSRFALQQLPSMEMPEEEMPREVAYRMIKDDLSLDGNPMLKYVRPLQCSGMHNMRSMLWYTMK